MTMAQFIHANCYYALLLSMPENNHCNTQSGNSDLIAPDQSSHKMQEKKIVGEFSTREGNKISIVDEREKEDNREICPVDKIVQVFTLQGQEYFLVKWKNSNILTLQCRSDFLSSKFLKSKLKEYRMSLVKPAHTL